MIKVLHLIFAMKRSLSRLAFLSVILLLATRAAFSQVATPSPTPRPRCPIVTISAPPTTVRSGETAAVSLTTSSDDPTLTPEYTWTVSGGRVIGGLGTSSITVDTTGVNSRDVMVSLSVKFSESCTATASSAFRVGPLPTGTPPPIPEFPWPPHRASASQIIPVTFLRNPTGQTTLRVVADRIESAFDQAGYGERSWYAVPGGFAMASRIEQIRTNGIPVSGSARFVDRYPPPIETVGDYIRALFTANPGYYRVIVFIVTNHPFTQVDATVSSTEAAAWLMGGANTLPDEIGRLEFSTGHQCTALIYEYELRQSNPPTLVSHGGLTGRQHLERAGIWSRLSR